MRMRSSRNITAEMVRQTTSDSPSASPAFAAEAPRTATRTPNLRGRKRILVVGSGGAGKSTFARALAAKTGLPLIHLDRYYWRPGWQPTPAEEWNAVVMKLCRGQEWIMDGNYGGSLEIRLRRCDAVVFLDFPKIQCLWGVVRRRFGARARPDMADGCHERLDLEFLRWIWNYPRVSRPRIIRALRSAGSDVKIVTVASRENVRALLAACA
jgi:adenylate kinase family enzyme